MFKILILGVLLVSSVADARQPTRAERIEAKLDRLLAIEARTNQDRSDMRRAVDEAQTCNQRCRAAFPYERDGKERDEQTEKQARACYDRCEKVAPWPVQCGDY